MGLNIAVSCRCYIEGKTQPPCSGSIKVDEEGRFELDLPFEGNEEEHRLFSQWIESGCEHPRMLYALEGVNWFAYRSFQRALEVAGWQHFPTLRAELPETNDGLTAASAALPILEELSFFTERADLGWTTVLVDTDTGEELHEYIPAYGGEFHVGHSGYNFGVDDEGFFIRGGAGGEMKEVFRARRVQQVLPKQDSLLTGSQPMVDFINLDTGLRYACAEPMVKIIYGPNGALQHTDGQTHLGFPLRMHVTKRKRTASDYDHFVRDLRVICEAAIQTGNPILWR
jgi:hypothetical protein